MFNSQPLNLKLFKDVKFNDLDKMVNKNSIKRQYMGHMFDSLKNSNTKINILDRLKWLKRDVRNGFYDTKHTITNLISWTKTLSQLRPWEGFDGILTIVQKHLKDYIETEEKYGHSEEEFKDKKISSAKECLEILKRLQDDDYDTIEYDKVNKPPYVQLVTEYEHSISYSGYFLPLGNGWAGFESGKDPRTGYFEMVDGKFELVQHTNQKMVDSIIEQINNYHKDFRAASEKGILNRDNDVNRLFEILRSNFWTWWD